MRTERRGPAASERSPATVALYLAPALTLTAIGLAEFLEHILRLPSRIGAGVLLLGLIPIAYAGLNAGFRAGLVSTLLLATYTLHYTSPHEVLLANESSTWSAGGIVLALGLAMTWPMSRIKRRQDVLRKALEERIAEAEARNRELVQAVSALEAFGYVVSHDLKEPVRALENYLDAAREEWPSEESRSYLDESYQANQRLMDLLQGLLAYSRTSSVVTNLVPLQIEEVVHSDACRAQYARQLQSASGELEIEDDLPPVLGDEVVMCQLLGNLVLNGLKHNDAPRPRVRIRSEGGQPDVVHLVIEDNGSGFPPEVLHHFRNLRDGKPGTIKTGFGLVIAHKAAQRLGGQLWIENGEPDGRGARVHVELPAVPHDAVEETAPTSDAAPPRPA